MTPSSRARAASVAPFQLPRSTRCLESIEWRKPMPPDPPASFSRQSVCATQLAGKRAVSACEAQQPHLLLPSFFSSHLRFALPRSDQVHERRTLRLHTAAYLGPPGARWLLSPRPCSGCWCAGRDSLGALRRLAAQLTAPCKWLAFGRRLQASMLLLKSCSRRSSRQAGGPRGLFSQVVSAVPDQS